MIFVCITISSEWFILYLITIFISLHPFPSPFPLYFPWVVLSAQLGFSASCTVSESSGAQSLPLSRLSMKEKRDEKQRQIKKEESGRKDFGLAPKSTWIAGGRMERLVNWKRAEKQSSGQSGYLLLCSTRLLRILSALLISCSSSLLPIALQ